MASSPTYDTLHMRIDPTLKARLRELAEADSRPLAVYISLVLKNHVAEHESARSDPKRGTPRRTKSTQPQ